jgi:hypothetical protein
VSEKEKALLEGIAKLPDKLQDKFLERIQGAVMALDTLGAEKEDVDGGKEGKR